MGGTSIIHTRKSHIRIRIPGGPKKKRSNFEAVLLMNYTTEKLQIWMV